MHSLHYYFDFSVLGWWSFSNTIHVLLLLHEARLLLMGQEHSNPVRSLAGNWSLPGKRWMKDRDAPDPNTVCGEPVSDRSLTKDSVCDDPTDKDR